MLLILSCFVLLPAVTYARDQPKVLLNDGNKMPAIAFGTFGKIDEIYKVEQSVKWAIEAGYRHVDTAAFYLNEEEIGKALKDVLSQGTVKREDLFITTKLNFGYNGSMVLPALTAALNKLQLDYVDLYLIHTPINWLTREDFDIVDTWKGMEEVIKLGLARSIGVSNFNITQINMILSNGKVPPAVNQIEVNPTFTNEDLVSYCQQKGIVIESYAPNGFLVPRPFQQNIPPPSIDDPILTELAKKYNKSVHQLFIRYLVDRGTVPIPKSFTKHRLEENLDVFDISISKEDMTLMNEINKDRKVYDFRVEVMEALIDYYYGMRLEDFFDS